MTEIMPSLQNLINLSYDPAESRRLFLNEKGVLLSYPNVVGFTVKYRW